MKNSYHNVTAHYNGYWIANERIIEIEQNIEDRYQWDYNRMLPVFAQFDTTTSKSLEETLLDCIEKASIAIQRHPDSRWEDDAYILVGLARLYGSEFPEAIETFKYVNTHGDLVDDRNKALIYLMRTFIEAGELDNAAAVSSYIDKNELSDEAIKELAITRSYYFQKSNRTAEMADQLQKAMPYLNGDERQARLAFTLGQALQLTGSDSLAYIYYKEAIRHSKTYDLSFYSRLNMSQVSQANANASTKEIQKYFRKLLKDPKNEEYKGRILFEVGNFNYKNNDLNAAIENYKESLLKNKKDPRLKSYTYNKLASIYYDQIKDFRLAKAYYDSTVTGYPQEEPIYSLIKTRAEVLTDFVGYYETIQLNDSLLALSTISEDSLNQWVSKILDQREANAIAAAEKKAKEEKRAAIFETSEVQGNQNLIDINTESEGTWYFYNATELSKGFSNFKNKWGQRILEDNWRRSLKTGTGETNSESEEIQNIVRNSNNEQSEKEEKPVFDREAEKKIILASIPNDETAKWDLLHEIEEATYQIGKIYNFKLEEKENAISTFEGFVIRFDTSRYLPEVLYQLFLLYKNRDSLQSAYYFEKLTIEHDTSIYAKLAINPNYINERDQENENYKKIYVKAFDLYEKGFAQVSQQLIDSALFSNPQNEYVDNLHLLSAMNYGLLEGKYKYQFELSNFIKSYSESELIPYAEKLLKTSQDFQINLYSSSRAQYIENFETRHYFILVYPYTTQLSSAVPEEMDAYLKQGHTSLSTGNLILDEENAVVLVNEFSNKDSAQSFLSTFKSKEKISSKFVEVKFYPMVITDENFQIFFETKDLESYITFHSKHYK